MLQGFDMGILDRMFRAAKLDSSLYEEVEKDTKATNQAVLVVVIASICSGIGAAIAGQMTGGLSGLILGLVMGVVSALVGWFVWSFITYFIGTKLFKGPQTEATYGQLLRCIGFSDTPQILGILTFIPVLGWAISLLAAVWSLVAMVIGVRQALDFSTGRAVATCIVGFIVLVIILALVAWLTGGLFAPPPTGLM